MHLLLGGTLPDPGVTASDGQDGDLSGSVVVGGDSVNMSVEGTYSITYNVSDSDGNAAVEVTRVVNIVHPIDARNYEFSTQWGTNMLADGAFQSPTGITLDSNGNVWVSDNWNQRIQSFTSSGVFRSLFYVGGIAGGFMDPDDNLYITTGDCKIYKYDTSGNVLLSWGNPGTGNGEFDDPRFIAMDGTSVYVTDTGNNRVQKFDMGGNFIAAWGSNGTGDGEFSEPEGIAVSGGSVYVADSGNNRIQKFDTGGTWEATWGSIGSGNGQFNFPRGIYIDGNYLYVAD